MKKILFIKKFVKNNAVLILLVVSLFTLPQKGYSQDDPVLDDDFELPCGGDNPYGTDCPLDTWTFILVVAGVSFGAASIHLAQKRADKAANIEYMNITTKIKKSA